MTAKLFPRCIYLSLLVTCISVAGLAQDSSKIFTKVEIASGPDPAAWQRYSKRATQLPDSLAARLPAGTYQVQVRGMLDVHGELHQLRALNDPGFGLAARALSIVRQYPGEWRPASQCGRLVNSYFTKTLVFTVRPVSPKRDITGGD